MSEDSKTTIYSMKCMNCGLHFNIYTWYPERHSIDSIFCPECGLQGKFIIWKSVVGDPIFRHVPYSNQLDFLLKTFNGFNIAF